MLFKKKKTKSQFEYRFVGRSQEFQALVNHFENVGRHALIVGRPGMGKTAFTIHFMDKSSPLGLFPAGCMRLVLSFPDRDHILSVLNDIRIRLTSGPTLVVFDEFDGAPIDVRRDVIEFIKQNNNIRSIICVNREQTIKLPHLLTITLRGLSRDDFLLLLKYNNYWRVGDNQLAHNLYNLVSGHPAFAHFANMSIRESLLTLNQVLSGIAKFDCSGIHGPDGNPLTMIPEPTKIAVMDTNAILIKKLRSNPSLLREISSRRFEEIIAELLNHRGYIVNLTPPSQDGGFDIYAARRDDLGQFLFLVECKQYTPPNKVGVSIVRSLHGVVQQQQANAGIIVTSSYFTRGATEFQQSIPYQIQLRDYFALQKWLGILKS